MKYGLCLAGGGIKGAAHIGAIKAFEEENISFNCIAGTSSGSIIASLIASGYNSDEIYNIFKKYAKKIKGVDWKNIFKIIYDLITKGKLIITGFKNSEIIEKLINQFCQKKNIADINDIEKELLIPAVDTDDGRLIVFNSCKIDIENKNSKYVSSAPIGKVVRASCSYPIVFTPCDYEGKDLLDGGIKQNVPWNELKAIGCDKILAINFESKEKKKCCDNLIDIAERSFELICEELNRLELESMDFIHTITLDKVSLLEIEKMDELYKEGYNQTKKNMKEIIKYLNE